MKDNSGNITEAVIANSILALAQERGITKSLRPSEVARQLGADDDWRSLMEPVRHIAYELAEQGKIQILQRGLPVDLQRVKGPIRIRIASAAIQ